MFRERGRCQLALQMLESPNEMRTRRKPLGSATVDVVGDFNKRGLGNLESATVKRNELRKCVQNIRREATNNRSCWGSFVQPSAEV